MSAVIYTIGHSTHPMGYFCGLLAQHAIGAIVDVRSAPFSRFNPQYNRENLERSLEQADISYVWLGRELGARSEDSNCYVDGKVSYDLLANTASFQHGVERLREGMKKYRIALMCAEKDPLTCHRTILVARHLTMVGVRVLHILDTGKIETHDAAIERLQRETKVHHQDLFLSGEQLLKAAYRKREEQIAYRASENKDNDLEIVHM